MSKFRKKTKKSSYSIDEKITYLNNELKKTGMLDESGPANSTSNMYTKTQFVPYIPATMAAVPDSSGVTDPGWTQPGDESDTDTWDEGDFENTTLYKDTSYLYNPNELNGTANREILHGADPNLRAAAGLPAGGGIAINGNYYGTAIGYIGSGQYHGVLSGGLTGGTNAPTESSRLGGGAYSGLGEESFAHAQALWNVYYQNYYNDYNNGSLTTKSVKVWVNYNRHHHYQRGGEYATWTATPKSGGKIIESVAVIIARNQYQDQDTEHSKTIVLQRIGLGDPSYYPGDVGNFLTKLLDVGKRGWDYLKNKSKRDNEKELQSVRDAYNSQADKEDPDRAAKELYFAGPAGMAWNYLEPEQKQAWRDKAGQQILSNQKRVVDKASNYGLDGKSIERMVNDGSMGDWLDEMDKIQSMVDKTAANLKDVQKERRKLVTEFGIDVILTVTGPAILKGIFKGVKLLSGASKAKQIARMTQIYQKSNLSKAEAAIKAAKAYEKVNKTNKLYQTSKKLQNAARASKIVLNNKASSIVAPVKGAIQSTKSVVSKTVSKVLPKSQQAKVVANISRNSAELSNLRPLGDADKIAKILKLPKNVRVSQGAIGGADDLAKALKQLNNPNTKQKAIDTILRNLKTIDPKTGFTVGDKVLSKSTPLTQAGNLAKNELARSIKGWTSVAKGSAAITGESAKTITSAVAAKEIQKLIGTNTNPETPVGKDTTNKVINVLTDLIPPQLSSLKTPTKMLLGFLSGSLVGKNAGEVIPEHDQVSSWKNLEIKPESGSLSVKGHMQNVFGGEPLSHLTVDNKGNAVLKFNFAPNTNQQEFDQHPGKYSAEAQKFYNNLGTYAADLVVGVPIPGIGGSLGNIIGLTASALTSASKKIDQLTPDDSFLGGIESARNISGDIKIPLEKLKEVNLKAYNYLKSQNVKESYLKEDISDVSLAWASPKHTNVDSNERKRWFNTKDVQPLHPDKENKIVNGYHADSKIAPKKESGDPFIKISETDILRNHKLSDHEKKEWTDTINAINEFLEAHPEELIHAQQRYPKSDPKLAELNWNLDQMLGASDEYMDSHFPENTRLFNKLQKATKKTIQLTDPEYIKRNYNEIRGTIRTVQDFNQYGSGKTEKISKINRKSAARFFKRPGQKSASDIIDEKIRKLEKDSLI